MLIESCDKKLTFQDLTVKDIQNFTFNFSELPTYSFSFDEQPNKVNNNVFLKQFLDQSFDFSH